MGRNYISFDKKAAESRLRAMRKRQAQAAKAQEEVAIMRRLIEEQLDKNRQRQTTRPKTPKRAKKKEATIEELRNQYNTTAVAACIKRLEVLLSTKDEERIRHLYDMWKTAGNIDGFDFHIPKDVNEIVVDELLGKITWLTHVTLVRYVGLRDLNTNPALGAMITRLLRLSEAGIEIDWTTFIDPELLDPLLRRVARALMQRLDKADRQLIYDNWQQLRQIRRSKPR